MKILKLKYKTNALNVYILIMFTTRSRCRQNTFYLIHSFCSWLHTRCSKSNCITLYKHHNSHVSVHLHIFRLFSTILVLKYSAYDLSSMVLISMSISNEWRVRSTGIINSTVYLDVAVSHSCAFPWDTNYTLKMIIIVDLFHAITILFVDSVLHTHC